MSLAILSERKKVIERHLDVERNIMWRQAQEIIDHHDKRQQLLFNIRQ